MVDRTEALLARYEPRVAIAAAPGGAWVTVPEAELAAGDVAGEVAPAGLVPPEAVGAPPCPGPIFPATKAPAPTEASTATAAAAISQPRRAGRWRTGAAARLSQGGTGDAIGRSNPDSGSAAGWPQWPCVCVSCSSYEGCSSGRSAVGTHSGALRNGETGPAASSVGGCAGMGGG